VRKTTPLSKLDRVAAQGGQKKKSRWKVKGKNGMVKKRNKKEDRLITKAGSTPQLKMRAARFR